MLLAGSDDGVYRLPDLDGPADRTAEQILDSGRVMRLRTFDAVDGGSASERSEPSSDSPDGAFAATTTGLFHSPDGETWVDLGVPTEAVYSVGALPDGRLYAGTRPARVYVGEFEYGTDAGETDDIGPAVEWRECEGFQALPSREEWRLPRHDDLAQVKDLHRDPADPDRLVAGVEVGGVHGSDDGGETWVERRGDDSDGEGVDDDIHELHVVGPGEYVAATGFGLFRTTDAGESWTRLDEGVDQRYFRTAFSLDGVVYAGGALANSSTWDDPDADPVLLAVRDGSVERVEFPAADETVTGMTAVGGDPVVATHRGSVLVRRGGEWASVGDLPVPGEPTGRYTPLTRLA
ncbi:WD40 repeat domain-containing protein [Halosimplex rubrum]|uniref:WD40 repeat domain-containing protein n=1 Tax=Halosimplex rubrum TaxID=869889 RepID=A0A7D5P987_9EURY|nr:WD40 repeat domain-containing protein [Halosimplex rubrum]QLH76799.1 WD40 repeat domain-containing protein [Halosimplex rubrum]